MPPQEDDGILNTKLVFRNIAVTNPKNL